MAGITIRGLSKVLGEGEERAIALHELDLDIGENRFVTLYGPGGSGKTTALRLIAGDLVPDAGTIHMDGRLLSSPEKVVPPADRGVGMIFQNLALWPHRTVFENVMFGLKVRGVPPDEAQGRVQQVLALVKMAGLGAHYPENLAAGQQQRVAIARCLVVEPKILLLDEPLAGLDARLQERMRGELKQLQRHLGITFVYAAHDRSEAFALSDQVAVMDSGRLQQFGTPQEVYANPANRTVASLMGIVNALSGRVHEVRAGVARIDAGPDLRLEIPVRDGVAVGDELEVIVRPENVRLSRLEPPAVNGAAARVTDATFLGNITEYYATLASGRVMRAQSHPIQRFAVGDKVSVEIDVTRCNIFRAPGGRARPAE